MTTVIGNFMTSSRVRESTGLKSHAARSIAQKNPYELRPVDFQARMSSLVVRNKTASGVCSSMETGGKKYPPLPTCSIQPYLTIRTSYLRCTAVEVKHILHKKYMSSMALLKKRFETSLANQTKFGTIQASCVGRISPFAKWKDKKLRHTAYFASIHTALTVDLTMIT